MSTTTVPRPASGEVVIPQLRRRGVLAVWAAAAVPMGVLAWVVAPLVADHLDGPAPLARTLIVCLTAGLVWQFVLVAVLVRREQGTLRWPVVREALWLRAPRNSRTGRRGGRLWLVLIPAVAWFAAEQFVPALPVPAARDFGAFMGSDAGAALLGGSWGWLAVLVVLWVFNTVLGEELLFRGYLLPRMSGAFGRYDWVVNGLLFACYHVHLPWVIPSALLDMVALALPSRRYRSALIGIAVHSAQSVFLLALVLPIVLHG
ncbi:CPBP family intramembrane glutamic endopeptidase [Petropleomorpha daqingensis]|uniref:Membrane protease YdiL (CAAX protease family) n=1 Tax=Petropleomorpha daqingensis TaxID=2026353 RepID=A0A853CIZ7_9ACTN|nr:type II CAAX endopeptidase family protein [Petropleomorpha daqingensis]NYJ07306.1 membrane protease YdiL (CAAX protease family) [Petropleomorpha daqingensis]